MASIRKRGPGSYTVTVYKGEDSEGKQIRYNKTIHVNPDWTEKNQLKEVNRQAALFEEGIKGRKYAKPSRETFKTASEEWLAYKKDDIGIKTYAGYSNILNSKRIYDSLGEIRLKDLTSRDIENFYDVLRSTYKLNNNSIRHYHVAINQVLKYCVSKHKIDSNPCKDVEAPKVKKPDMDILEKEDIVKFIKALDKEPISLRLAFTLALITGCRRGELCGLQWDCVDLKKKVIDIKRTVVYVASAGLVTKEPKTATSKRKVAITTALVKLFKEYKLWQEGQKLKMGDQWHNTDYVFTRPDGQPMYTVTLSSEFRRIIDENGLPRSIHLHSLRHTVASMMLHEGLDVVSVASQLGHSSANITLSVYAHALEGANREAANIMDKLVNKKS